VPVWDHSDRVRIGFIGVGSRGRTLMLNVMDFQDRLNVDIVAVCDNWVEHKERAEKLTGGNAGRIP
jgi:predicted dinucleotide-utilizing enzyme